MLAGVIQLPIPMLHITTSHKEKPCFLPRVTLDLDSWYCYLCIMFQLTSNPMAKSTNVSFKMGNLEFGIGQAFKDLYRKSKVLQNV